MVTLAVRTWRTDGVTIVACRLANDADEPRTALLDSQVDGPARVAPAYQTDEATLRVTVPANGTVGTGFATPAAPTEPAVELIEERQPASAQQEAVLADLSEPRPPHDAVVDEACPGTEADSADGGSTDTDTHPTGANADTLDAIEQRIDRLEAVAAATTVPEAADALAEEGGLGAVRRLDARVQVDHDRLTELADRALTLAGRADAVEPRIETLDRLS